MKEYLVIRRDIEPAYENEYSEWTRVRKTNKTAVDLYSRHYSSKKSGKSQKDWLKHGITSPGESIVLITADHLALFVWLKQRYSMNNQTGINCAVFRNEGNALSSRLILSAEKVAENRWGMNRFYTYIDPTQVISTNPGYCFLMAGWNYVRKETSKKLTTSRGLLVMEKRSL